MTSENAETIAKVPERYEHSDRSTACLLEDAGFPKLRGAVNVEDVEQALLAQPELVGQWMARSQDQRIAGGWGIDCEGTGYRVQSYSGGDHLIIEDRIRACAEFIVRYVRFIGDVQAKTN
jgi:hypothetical protein